MQVFVHVVEQPFVFFVRIHQTFWVEVKLGAGFFLQHPSVTVLGLWGLLLLVDLQHLRDRQSTLLLAGCFWLWVHFFLQLRNLRGVFRLSLGKDFFVQNFLFLGQSLGLT